MKVIFNQKMVNEGFGWMLVYKIV